MEKGNPQNKQVKFSERLGLKIEGVEQSGLTSDTHAYLHTYISNLAVMPIKNR